MRCVIVNHNTAIQAGPLMPPEFRRINMKSLRHLVSAVLVSGVLVSSSAAFAQANAQPADQKMAGMDHSQKAPAPKSEAQVNFDTMKASLAGEWEGAISTDMSEAMKKAMGADGPIKPLHVTMRVTSRGNTITHEFQEAGTALDAAKYDHPITMIYVDNDQLNLVHYCDAGNRPHMLAKLSPDGKTMDFDFTDLSGSNKHGHMAHSTFTIIDANHHIEEWTYMLPNNVPIHAKFELHRVNGSIAGVVSGGAQ